MEDDYLIIREQENNASFTFYFKEIDSAVKIFTKEEYENSLKEDPYVPNNEYIWIEKRGDEVVLNFKLKGINSINELIDDGIIPRGNDVNPPQESCTNMGEYREVYEKNWENYKYNKALYKSFLETEDSAVCDKFLGGDKVKYLCYDLAGGVLRLQR